MSKGIQHETHYKLALYGLSASGKTCVLAALSMKRSPHPLEYIGERIPYRFDESADASAEDKQLQKCEEWMKAAIERLKNHDVPPPSPTDTIHLQYHFSTPEREIFNTELIDYSGGLLDPETTANQLTEELEQRLHDCHGILILAEAPRHSGGDEQNRLWKELGKLQQAFSGLQEKLRLNQGEDYEGPAIDFPVALLINKWDRLGEINHHDLNTEQEKLKNFLNSDPPPPHVGLIQALRSSVTEGNFEVFPVSAFGAYEVVELEGANGKKRTVERPKQVEPFLHSFGLPDGFIWAARRHDQLLLQHYQQNAHTHLRTCVARGKSLLHRFPKDSDSARQVKKIQNICRQRWVKRISAIAIIVIAALLAAVWGVESSFDYSNYQHFASIASDPKATQDELLEAEKLMVGYIEAPYWRHFASKLFLTQGEAEAELLDLRQRQHDILVVKHRQEDETALQKLVIAAQDQALEIPGLNSLLEDLRQLPKHPHADTAELQQQRTALRNKIIARLQQIHDREAQYRHDENAKYLQELEQSINAANTVYDLEQIKPKFDTPPYPNDASSEQRELFVSLFSRYTNKLNTIGCKEKYDVFMGSADYLEAAKIIAYCEVNSREITNLRESFKTVVLTRLKSDIQEFLRQNRWEQAQEKLQQYFSYPSTLQTNKGKNKTIPALLDQVRVSRDKFLYEELRQLRDENAIRQYLDTAPLKSMKKAVQNYQACEARKLTELDLRLTVTAVHWHDIGGRDNSLKVFWNGRLVIHRGGLNADSSTGAIKSNQKIRGRLDTKYEIKVEIDHDTTIEWCDFNTKVAVRGYPEKLSGARIDVPGNRGWGCGSQKASVYIAINGLPPSTCPLPDWSNE